MVPSAYLPEAMWHHQDALNWILMSLVINAWWRAKTVTSWMTSNTELLPVANLAGGRETWARATVSIGNLVLLDIFSQLPFYSLLFQNWALLKWERGLKFFRCKYSISVTDGIFYIAEAHYSSRKLRRFFFRNEPEKKNVAPPIEDSHGVSFESQHGKEKNQPFGAKNDKFNR